MSEFHYKKALHIEIKTPDGEIVPAEFIYQDDYYQDDVDKLARSRTSGSYEVRTLPAHCGRKWPIKFADGDEDDFFDFDFVNISEWLGAAILESHNMKEAIDDGFSYRVTNPEDYDGEDVDFEAFVFGDMYTLSRMKSMGELDYKNLEKVVIASSLEDANTISLAFPDLPKTHLIETEPFKEAFVENNKNISQKIFQAAVIENARSKHIKNDTSNPRKIVDGIIESMPFLTSDEKKIFKEKSISFESFSGWFKDISDSLKEKELSNIGQLTAPVALSDFKIVNNDKILNALPFVCALSTIKEKDVVFQGLPCTAYYLKEPYIVDPDSADEEFLCLAAPNASDPSKSKVYTNPYIENMIDFEHEQKNQQKPPTLKPKI